MTGGQQRVPLPWSTRCLRVAAGGLRGARPAALEGGDRGAAAGQELLLSGLGVDGVQVSERAPAGTCVRAAGTRTPRGGTAAERRAGEPAQNRSTPEPRRPERAGELVESHGGGCSVEGESSRPIAFPQRTRGRAGEGWGTCERARV